MSLLEVIAVPKKRFQKVDYFIQVAVLKRPQLGGFFFFVRFNNLELQAEISALTRLFCCAPKEPCFGRSCEGSLTVFPSDARSSFRKLHKDLYAGTDWKGESLQGEKKKLSEAAE